MADRLPENVSVARVSRRDNRPARFVSRSARSCADDRCVAAEAKVSAGLAGGPDTIRTCDLCLRRAGLGSKSGQRPQSLSRPSERRVSRGVTGAPARQILDGGLKILLRERPAAGPLFKSQSALAGFCALSVKNVLEQNFSIWVERWSDGKRSLGRDSISCAGAKRGFSTLRRRGVDMPSLRIVPHGRAESESASPGPRFCFGWRDPSESRTKPRLFSAAARKRRKSRKRVTAQKPAQSANRGRVRGTARERGALC
jgi:hypothetical protein